MARAVDEGTHSATRSVTPLLQMRGIGKRFGGVVALEDVDLTVEAGSVHAVLGENGAGKSTLMKVLAGAHAPDDGTIELDGELRRLVSPADAVRAGIVTVHQEPPLYPRLSVLENFLLGRAPRDRTGGIAWRAGRREATEALERVGVDPRRLDWSMDRLSIGVQQLVLIARAISQRPRLLILDEPTSMLSSAETDRLFGLVDELRAEGTATIYISHRMAEIFRVAQRVTVLRDGRRSAEVAVADVDEDRLITLMSGRRISTALYRPPGPDALAAAPRLSVRGLTRAGAFRDVDLDVRPGEILGLYGLVGAGRSEVAQAIFGSHPPDAGEIRLDGEVVAPRRAADGIARGIAYLAEDRRTQGAFLGRSVADNLTSAILPRLRRRFGRLDVGEERRAALEAIRELHIRTPDAATPVGELSGGSQQKVIFARWMLTGPRVLILDEPTRGIDVGTKAQIHELVLDLARDRGEAVVLISSELTEVLALADRVLVMREGAVVSTLERAEASEQAVLRAALGSRERTVAEGPDVEAATPSVARGPGAAA